MSVMTYQCRHLLPEESLRAALVGLNWSILAPYLVKVRMSETGGSADGTRSLRVTHTNLMLIL